MPRYIKGLEDVHKVYFWTPKSTMQDGVNTINQGEHFWTGIGFH